MDVVYEFDFNYLRRTFISIIIALLIIFGGGFVFVSAIRHIHKPVDAAVEESDGGTQASLLGDVPVYKGGVVSPGKDIRGDRACEIIFSMGTIAEVKTFYSEEMAKAGWHEYASGERVSVFNKENGHRKTSLAFSYYAGKVKLRIYQPGS